MSHPTSNQPSELTARRIVFHPRRMLPYLALAMCVLIISSLHFARPERNPKNTLRLNAGRITYLYDKDTKLFVWLAAAFPRALATEDGKLRQERPLYIAAGWLTWQILKPLRPLISDSVADRIQSQLANSKDPARWAGAGPRDLLLIWIGYILLNLVMYWLASALLYAALRDDFNAGVAFALSIIPLTHFNTIDFVVVPHTEPLNVLLPALFVFSLSRFRRESLAIGTAAVTGVAMLAKSFPVGALSWLVEAWRQRRTPRRAVLYPIVGSLIFLPSIAYPLYLLTMGITPYMHTTTAYRQVVWMSDYWSDGRYFDIPVTILTGIGTHFFYALLTWSVYVVFTVLLLFFKRRQHFIIPGQLRQHLVVYFVGNLIFWGLVNYHTMRLSVVDFPPLIYALGYLSVTRTNRPAFWITATIALQLTAWAFGLFDPMELH